MITFVISAQRTTKSFNDKSITDWWYLMQDHCGDWLFTINPDRAFKFTSCREAQKLFNTIKDDIIRNINLSTFDLSTLSVRKVTYSVVAKLPLLDVDNLNTDPEFHIGDKVYSKTDLFDSGVIYDINPDGTAEVEFSLGFGGGSGLYKLSDLELVRLK